MEESLPSVDGGAKADGEEWGREWAVCGQELPWPVQWNLLQTEVAVRCLCSGLGPWWGLPQVPGVVDRPHGRLSGGLSKSRPGWRELNPNESQVGPHLCWAAPPGFDQ